ncbi:MAG TPA: MerR family transcriptional regulator [Acidimicrobiia bacterium]|nr:MerR family transcriptional regulator [Acidimicrobiia bacterium]HEV3450941.1 MerR family transcriptional regulator [Acidimicrobiia bacterium]
MAEVRVEELARRTETSVDTIRFYQKRRLLPPPRREGRVAWYDTEHLERLLRIRELQGRGFSLAVIRRLLDGELDAADEPLAAAVVAASDDELLTLDELAARAGVPSALLEAVAREGLLVARRRDGEPRFAASDAAVVAAGLQLLSAGLPLPELLALAQSHDTATRAIAERAVTLFDVHVRQPLRDADLGAEERARRLVEAFRTLLPTVTTLVEHHFRAVLLEVAQEHLESVGEPAELDAARAEPDWGGAAGETGA